MTTPKKPPAPPVKKYWREYVFEYFIIPWRDYPRHLRPVSRHGRLSWC